MEEPESGIKITITINNAGDFISQIADEVVRKIELRDASKASPPEELDKPLTIDEAAILVKLKKPTLYSLVSQRAIPYSKPLGTKRLWFSRLELIEWMQSGRRKTKVEIEEQANTYLRIRKKK